MPYRGQLNERQLLLLRRIAEGDDLSGPDGVRQRGSARALQARRLVTVSRKVGTWRAHVTAAGSFYLEHGHHPDRPDQKIPNATSAITAQGPSSRSSPRRASTTPSRPPAMAKQAKELLERLQREGGTIRVEEPDEPTRALYRRVLHAAKQHQLVPDGFHLLHTGRDRGDIVIRLSEDTRRDDTDWNRVRLTTRRITTDPELAIAALENDPENVEVSESQLPRALELIRALAAAASARGHRLGVNTKTKHPRIFLKIGQIQRSITLREDHDQVPHVPTDKERREQRRNSWVRLPEFDSVPSGRLHLEIGRDGWRHDSWSDTKRVKLEQRLRRVVRDVEAGVAADEQARAAARKAAEEAAAEFRRQQEETRARWQAAMAKARVHAVEKLRTDAFRRAYDAWAAANEIRGFCDALEADQPVEEPPSNLTRWVGWARAEADRIDPTRGAAALAKSCFDPEPQADDLRPFLGEWSPRGPHKDYRTERDEERLTAIREYTATWHHGMRGRPTWWRGQR